MRLFLLIILSSSSLPILGKADLASVPVKLDGSDLRQKSFGYHISFIEDIESTHEDELVIQGQYDSEFIPSEKETPKFGYNKNYPFWGRFELENTSAQTLEVLLESYYGPIDYITLYHIDPAGNLVQKKLLGDKVPFSRRDIKYRNPVFKIDLEPGVSTFYFKAITTSGVQFNFYLWDRTTFEGFKFEESIFMGLLLGGIAVMGFYNMFLAISLKSRTYAIYMAYIITYLIFASIYYGMLPYFFGDDAENLLFTGADLYIVIDLISIVALAFSIDFLNTKEHSKFIYNTMLVLIAISAVNIVVNIVSGGTVAAGIKLSIFNSLFNSLLLITSGAYVWLRKNYEPAKYYVLAWSLILTGNIVMILEGATVITGNFWTSWSQLTGSAAEMITLSLALGSKMAVMRKQKFILERELRRESEEKKKAQEEMIRVQEESIRNLDEKVKEKTRDIREILLHIKQGIFTFNEEFKIQPEYSSFLETMFAKKDMAGLDVFDSLFDKTDVSGDDLSRTKAILENSVGEDELSWEANSSGLIRNMKYDKSELESTYIELEWSPVVKEDLIEKILVSARDVTEIKRLERESSERGRELATLVEILSQDMSKVDSFLARTDNRILSIRSVMKDFKHTSEHIDHLYRELHTIKGNARSLGFKRISDLAHEVEDVLKNFADGKAAEQELFSATSELFEVVKQYEDLFNDKIKNISLGNSKTTKNHRFDSFIFDIIRPGILRLAKDLGKPPPDFAIHNPDDYHIIGEQSEEIFQNILNHLARNSIDHGIEPEEERVRTGKSPRGTITISVAIIDSRSIRFEFYDDGRGLNLSKLRKVSLAKGYIDESAGVQEIAKQIFVVGVSTADKITDISGRGVGMDAVSHYVEALHASLDVILPEGVDFEGLLAKLKSGEEDVFLPFSIQGDFALEELTIEAS